MWADRLSPRELVILSLLTALAFGSKVAMSFLPNIHLVAVLLILITLRFGANAFYSAILYTMLEGLVYGFGIWWVSYLYIWPLLVLCALPLRKGKHRVLLSLLAAVHGFLFGALCAIPYAIAGGPHAGIAYWVAGIPYDLIHGASNFILCMLLLPPLDRLMGRLWGHGS